MAGKFAATTEVSADKSKAELERILARYGADRFGYAWDEHGRVAIQFRMQGRQIRFVMPMPKRDAAEFTTYYRGSVPYFYQESEAVKRWEQATRQRWRALNLVVKANLEAVELGILRLEEAFLSQTLMPNGATVGDWAASQLDHMLTSGQMPDLLPQLSTGR